ncbi:MAG: CpaF family protein, partial [Ruegeria sp.]
MFSRYAKKPAAQPVGSPAKTPEAAAPTAPTAGAQTSVARKPAPSKKSAEPKGSDRDRKRKERLGEIKLELHRELLENLNLGALENAAEADLRSEISAISSEVLEQKSIAL